MQQLAGILFTFLIVNDLCISCGKTITLAGLLFLGLSPLKETRTTTTMYGATINAREAEQ